MSNSGMRFLMTCLLNGKLMSSKVPTLMKCKEVQTTLTISKATIYRWMDAGTFPRPIQLGPHMVRWKRSDINNWLTEKGGFLDERGHPNF